MMKALLIGVLIVVFGGVLAEFLSGYLTGFLGKEISFDVYELIVCWFLFEKIEKVIE